MKNKYEENRIKQIVRSNISQSKRFAIELKKSVDQKAALKDSINRTRRNMNFIIDETLVVPDITGKMLDYLSLEELSKSLSSSLSKCMSVAVSYVCELICSNINNGSSLLEFTNDLIQIDIIVANTAPLGVDYSALAPVLCKTHICLLENNAHTVYQGVATRILELIKKL